MNFEYQYQSVLKRLIRPGEQCVLVDYPNHSNVGDSAIWLGEHVVLKSAGIGIVSIGDLFYDSWSEIAESIGDKTILIHGGGNFGDLWNRHQQFREQLCKEFPNNRIIQLPQSVFFQDDAKRIASRDIFLAHQDVHLMVRDKPSMNIISSFAPGRCYLVPDSALCLPHFNMKARPRKYDLLLLFRTDDESTRPDMNGIVIPKGLRVNATDWLEEDVTIWHRYYMRLHQTDKNKRLLLRPFINALIRNAAVRLANARFMRGIDLIADARVVVTDRLHTVILSWLCGIPVFYSDNSYGKLGNVIDCWLDGNKDIHRFGTHADAFSAAVSSLRDN